MAKLDAELTAMGFDARAWRRRPGKRLIWSEFGLGGGVSRCGDTPAKTRATVGRWAHLDVGYPWTAATDPWSIPDLRVRRLRCHGGGCTDHGAVTLPRGGVSAEEWTG